MNSIFLFFFLLIMNPPTEKITLTVTIDNIQNQEGTLEIGLFNTGERFLEEGQAYKTISINVESKSETFVIKNLPSGKYALSLYHDVNANGKCDRNLIGIPKEPYAFSNNFRPKFNAPSFSDCEFELKADKTLKIELR